MIVASFVLEDQVDGVLEAVLEGPGLLEAVLELELEDQVDELDDEKGRQGPGAGGSPRGPANPGAGKTSRLSSRLISGVV